jgi:hypothetical protein
MSEEVKGQQPDDSTDQIQLASFLKYCSDDERVIRGIFEDHKVRFTQPWALNDPLEFNPSIRFKNPEKYRWFHYDGIAFPSEELWGRTHLIESRINEFGVLSLTKIWDSFDMWSRYANGHRGFLLSLKGDFNERTCMLSPQGKPYAVEEVDYVDEYAVDMEELIDDQANFCEELAHKQLFFRKTSRWQAEGEWRMVRPLSDSCTFVRVANGPHRDDRVHLFDLHLDCIELVVFGACMSRENKKRIMKACTQTQVAFGQALIVRDKKERDTLGGKMGKVKILPIDRFPQLLEMLPFNFIADVAHLPDQQEVFELDSLSQLPYWSDGPAWIQQYYEHQKAARGVP